jgi:hypothetical protein
MNLKFLGLSAGLATTVVAGSFFGAAPAHALSIGDSLNLFFLADSQPNNINFYLSPTQADFANPVVAAFLGAQSRFVGTATGVGTNNGANVALAGFIRDLPTIPTGSVPGNFLQFPLTPVFNMSLTSFVNIPSSNPASLDYSFRGVFGNGLEGLGTLTTQSGTGVRSWSSTIRVIPTPALLPGLIGLGVTAMRRRKQSEQQAEA